LALTRRPPTSSPFPYTTLFRSEYLAGHDQVSWVQYAGLPSHPEHALAQKYFGGKPASILSFGIKGGREAGARFIDALQLILRLVDRKSTRLNSSHVKISYAVFC